ncbi:SPFH domain-containing protein [Candidatus Saccharibacteria bacterium]|jgi:regulator of protease activity HflC (stomatin/prohibitin superfamily)|nr:SPFH domain-containing protein [Candidatus Saccharibacteria bacterium]HPR09798.1 SPFH domain-containing protein [Candidatus Saccharibacteria bacterium]
MIWVLLVILIVLLFSGLYTVKQQTSAIVERFGRFLKVSNSGLNFKIPLIDQIAGRVSLRVQQLDVRVETKTKDNVFVFVVVSVQYYVLPTKVVDAFYRLQNPQEQITAYVFDTVRARVPNVQLDQLFETKDDIANAVKAELDQVMDDFGYGIVKALVTDIDPDTKVKMSMNEINAAQRLREAAIQQAEADKIRVVKAAEGEAESKALQGQGIANQRKAIIEGLKESVENFSSAVNGVNSQDVMNLVMMTQYFDTIKELGLSGKNSTILIPHGPGGMQDMSDQIRNAMITAEQVNKSTLSPKA